MTFPSPRGRNCDDDPLMTVAEVADYLGVSKTTVRKVVHQKAFPVVYVTADMRVRRSDLNTYIDSRRTFG